MSSTDTGFTDEELEESLNTAINQIEKHVYLGNLESREEKYLKLYQIKRIIRLVTLSEEKETDSGIQEVLTFHIPDLASSSIIGIIKECIPIIEKSVQAGENILIHCQGGVSRSATIVIGYIIHSKKISAEEALKYVESKRPCVWPNAGFWKELLSF